MNIRKNAREMGLLKYNSGRPCRSGHTSDRYVSNGCCIACQNGDAELARAEVMKTKQRITLALDAKCKPYTLMVKDNHQDIFIKLAEILQSASPDAALKIKNYVEETYINSPTSRALTRDDLLTFLAFENNFIKNTPSLELSHPVTMDEPIYIIHKGQYYRDIHCLEVLRGERLNVKPTMMRVK